MNKSICLALGLCTLSLQLNAQISSHRKKNTEPTYIKEYRAKSDSIRQSFTSRLEALSANRTSTDNSGKDVTVSPYMNRLVGPGVYYSSAVRNEFGLDWKMPSERTAKETSEGMEYRDNLTKTADALLLNQYLTAPASMSYCDTRFLKENLVENAVVNTGNSKNIKLITNKVEEIKDVKDIVGDVEVDLEIKRPNFWKFGGTFGLQLTQNYFSQNWYKGGNNNATLLSSVDAFARYDNQKNIQWDNKLELKLGFVTASSDSVHTFLTANDKIYLSSKLGIRAFDNFFYTMEGEAQTQFMPGYKSNDPKVYSKFFSPLDVFVSVGLDYKPKFKNIDLSVALLPLSYRMRYIGSDDENIRKSFKMPEDKKATHDIGSKANVNLTWKILKNLTWTSRLYYFTSYKFVEAEFENKFSFAFNKFFSTDLYTLWRFDDNRDMKYWDESLGFFQFKEYLTLGLSYSF